MAVCECGKQHRANTGPIIICGAHLQKQVATPAQLKTLPDMTPGRKVLEARERWDKTVKRAKRNKRPRKGK